MWRNNVLHRVFPIGLYTKTTTSLCLSQCYKYTAMHKNTNKHCQKAPIMSIAIRLSHSMLINDVTIQDIFFRQSVVCLSVNCTQISFLSPCHTCLKALIIKEYSLLQATKSQMLLIKSICQFKIRKNPSFSFCNK